MTNLAYKILPEPTGAASGGRVVEIHRVPQIAVDVFCETDEVTGAMQRALADRRMARVRSGVRPGGIAAAVAQYRNSVSPDVIIVESGAAPGHMRLQLDALADVCHASTKVIVIGHANDVDLYRTLLADGVSEYLVAPVDPVAVVMVVSGLYRASSAAKLGRSIAFVGARGGVGSSTMAHNSAATIGRVCGANVLLADLDLPFGTAGLDFKLDPTQGVAEALQDPSRLDELLLERLLHKPEENLSILTAPAALDSSQEPQPAAVERLLEVAQANVPFVVLDVPHVWTPWVRHVLTTVDEVVITAGPDLASLRNAKSLVDTLKTARVNDGPPKLVLNNVGMPKREEIKPGKFAAALQLELMATIPFDPRLFSKAANEGRVVADLAPRSPVAARFADVAQAITGRSKPATGWRERLRFGRPRV